jgi:hypothetical protein
VNASDFRTQVRGFPRLIATWIGLLWPDISVKHGHLDGLILISTSEYFGVMNVYVTLEDEQGNHIESDYALDRLGGVAVRTERVTV